MENKKTEWEGELKRWNLFSYSKELGEYIDCEEDIKNFIASRILEERNKALKMVFKNLSSETLTELKKKL